jgi:hypothetical protein
VPLLFLASIDAQPWSLAVPTFPAGSPWTTDVSGAATDTNSAAIIAQLVADGGFGSINMDVSFQPLFADCNTPRKPFTKRAGYAADCDQSIALVPMPNQGAIEGHADWTSSVGCSGDCHFTLWEQTSNLLYEGYQCEPSSVASGVPSGLTCGCLVVWDLKHVYPGNGRGDGCTSPDAAGFPVMPLLMTPLEASTGLNHALRFILPNNRMRASRYRHPASHCGGPTNPSTNAIEYGSRIRLRANYPETGTPGIINLIRGLKKYGAFLSDGGNLPFTIASDAFSVKKWGDADVGIPAPYHYGFTAGDFDVLPSSDGTASFTDCFSCVLNAFTPTIPTCPAGGVTTTTLAGQTPSPGAAAALACTSLLFLLILF